MQTMNVHLWAARGKEHQLPIGNICFQTHVDIHEGQMQRGPGISPMHTHKPGSGSRIF